MNMIISRKDLSRRSKGNHLFNFFSVFRYSTHKYIQTLLSTFTTVCIEICVIAHAATNIQ